MLKKREENNNRLCMGEEKEITKKKNPSLWRPLEFGGMLWGVGKGGRGKLQSWVTRDCLVELRSGLGVAGHYVIIWVTP